MSSTLPLFLTNIRKFDAICHLAFLQTTARLINRDNTLQVVYKNLSQYLGRFSQLFVNNVVLNGSNKCSGSGLSCPSDQECCNGACCDKGYGCSAKSGCCLKGQICGENCCSSGYYCCNGQCCPDSQGCNKNGCLSSCDGITCPSGQQCLNGSCCDNQAVCNEKCCTDLSGSGAICINGSCCASSYQYKDNGVSKCCSNLVSNNMCCPIGYKECNGACCREDLCINGVCVDCASDSQCTSGHCVANKCQECIVDADCLNGQTCSSNVCSGGCDTAYQYKDNDVVKCCSNLVFDNMCCQTGYKGCNGTCCREDLCINGACVDCASDTDCANGQTCSSNVCSGACDTAYQYKDNDVVKCCSNLVFDNMCCQTGYKGCNGTCCREDLCINGACVDCASDTDCANGAVCVNGSCSSDVIKDCGGACTDNQTCVDTQCCAGLDNPECWNANNGGCCPTDTECTSAGCCSRACNGGCCLRGQTCVNDVCV